MVPKPKYNIKEIEKLLKKFGNLPNKEKWEEIGNTFGKSGSAVHRWYYRQIKGKQSNKEVETKPDIATDTIRTVYLLLLGKGCRMGYYQAIDEIKALLEKL